MSKPLQVPYTQDDMGVNHYLSYPHWNSNVIIDPLPFKASMKITDSHRGRSAAQLVLVDIKDGETFPMFLNQAMLMLKDCTMTKGVITGWWYFIKRGANYSIAYSETEPVNV
jgi:hypothetical protein